MSHLCPADFYHKTTYNLDTQNQIWMSQLADGHDNFCDCKTPFGHLLASIFPPGHKDRDLTINEILLRDYQETCHSGGTGEKGSGGETTRENQSTRNTNLEDTEELTEQNIEELIAVADAAEEEDTR